jgi:hypothetical protein
MPYKTIMLELLQESPALYLRLKASRTLLRTIDLYSIELKSRHGSWVAELSRSQPHCSPEQITSEALEIAIQEVKESLPATPADEEEPLSLEAAMATIVRHTLPA